MSSREKILAAIRGNKPSALPMPEAFVPADAEGGHLERYTAVLQSIGGIVNRVEGWHDVQAFLEQTLQSGTEVVNGISQLSPCNGESYATKTAVEMEGVHTVFLAGELAVAENCAIWLSESRMINRLLPFLCQELVLVIEEKSIVANMHQAYQRIKTDSDGYGTFIAGPSKTADIEQSLVIGAHGPLSLKVFILAATAW